MSNILLIDTENVQLSPEGLECLDASTEIILFVSKNTNFVHPLCFKVLTDKGIKVSYECVVNQNNIKDCMDFYIVSYLGINAARAEKNGIEHHYFILSKDKGFNDVTKYIQGITGAKIEMIYSLEQLLQEDKPVIEENNSPSPLDEVIEETILHTYNQIAVTSSTIKSGTAKPRTIKPRTVTPIKTATPIKTVNPTRTVSPTRTVTPTRSEKPVRKQPVEEAESVECIITNNVWVRMKALLGQVKYESNVKLKNQQLMFEKNNVGISKYKLNISRVPSNEEEGKIVFNFVPQKPRIKSGYCVLTADKDTDHIVDSFIKYCKKL